VNTEGRVQYGARATFPKGDAREDWTILRALSTVMGKTLPYDTLSALRAKMIADHPTFGHVDYAPGAADAADFKPASLGADGVLSSDPIKSAIADFYLTNPIARASKTMAECSRLRAERNAMKVAAE
jgi:NADH-quinone oxidoreductase subunit G